MSTLAERLEQVVLPLERERDALRAQLTALQQTHNLLREAVNDSKLECLPECSDLGHAENCPYVNDAARLMEQQQTIRDLRAQLERVRELVPKLHTSQAHTYASVNADHYRGFDAGLQRAAEWLEATLKEPVPEGAGKEY